MRPFMNDVHVSIAGVNDVQVEFERRSHNFVNMAATAARRLVTAVCWAKSPLRQLARRGRASGHKFGWPRTRVSVRPKSMRAER
jgi:hypothetical protein